MAIIGLLTDFGTRDHYVATMKGVILQINPKVTIVDVSHDVASQDLLHGAFILRQAVPFFPAGSIFAAVIDPGVGTSRRILAARYADRTVLAPDNGLLTLLHRDADLQDMRVVENRRYFAATLSSTFHGRDIFAPVAAHLSRGVALSELGPSATRIEVLDLARPKVHPDGSIDGQVILEDRFGNLITNISERELSASQTPRHAVQVFVGGRSIGAVRTTYGDVRSGELIALVGSTRMLEVAVNGGRAADVLQAGRGTSVSVR